jgi:hypothetical protein
MEASDVLCMSEGLVAGLYVRMSPAELDCKRKTLATGPARL